MPLTAQQKRETAEKRAIVARVAYFEKNFDKALLATALGCTPDNITDNLVNGWILSDYKVWNFCRCLTPDDEKRLLDYLFNVKIS